MPTSKYWRKVTISIKFRVPSGANSSFDMKLIKEPGSLVAFATDDNVKTLRGLAKIHAHSYIASRMHCCFPCNYREMFLLNKDAQCLEDLFFPKK